jgi:bifunctional aspartokinase / homoserine dehydrogenase 1
MTQNNKEINSHGKIVVKFGGSNLKKKEDIFSLIRAVEFYNQPIVIVVSALYGVTDQLINGLNKVTLSESAICRIKDELIESHRQVIELYIKDSTSRSKVISHLEQRVEELEKYLRGIHCLGEIPEFVADRVLSYGERLSSLVLAAILNERQIDTKEILPEDLGLFTNGEYRNATVDFALSEQAVSQGLAGNQNYIIPGFYGLSPQSKVTLLGRGGSDYTAAAIARCINAQSVDLWKDVPGFLSADPKLVDNPSVIHQLTYNEAAELSYFGARIAHPRTFEPAEAKQIPVRLFNINDFTPQLEPITVIGKQGYIAEHIVKSVTFSDDFGVLKLQGAGVGIKPGIMAKVTGSLTQEGINIKSIITSQTTINILLSRADLENGLQVVNALGLSTVHQVSTQQDISLIAVVGEGILEKPGIAARVLGAVSAHDINVWTISAGASNVAIYFIIDRQEQETAIRSIHEALFGSPQVHVSVAPQNQEDYYNDHSYAGSLGYVV